MTIWIRMSLRTKTAHVAMSVLRVNGLCIKGRKIHTPPRAYTILFEDVLLYRTGAYITAEVHL